MTSREESKVIGEIGFDSLVEAGGSIDLTKSNNDSYVKIPSTGSRHESILLDNGVSVDALSLKDTDLNQTSQAQSESKEEKKEREGSGSLVGNKANEIAASAAHLQSLQEGSVDESLKTNPDIVSAQLNSNNNNANPDDSQIKDDRAGTGTEGGGAGKGSGEMGHHTEEVEEGGSRASGHPPVPHEDFMRMNVIVSDLTRRLQVSLEELEGFIVYDRICRSWLDLVLSPP